MFQNGAPIEQTAVDLVPVRVRADGAGSRHGAAPDAAGSDYREWEKICEIIRAESRFFWSVGTSAIKQSNPVSVLVSVGLSISCVEVRGVAWDDVS
jgi:hypothetical protein